MEEEKRNKISLKQIFREFKKNLSLIQRLEMEKKIKKFYAKGDTK